MKALSTAAAAEVAEPRTSARRRAQTISYTSAVAPDTSAAGSRIQSGTG